MLTTTHRDVNGRAINPGDLVMQIKGHPCTIGTTYRVVANVVAGGWKCSCCGSWGVLSPHGTAVCLKMITGVMGMVGVPAEFLKIINGEESDDANDASRKREELTVRRLHREAWTLRESLQDKQEIVKRRRSDPVRGLRAEAHGS